MKMQNTCQPVREGLIQKLLISLSHCPLSFSSTNFRSEPPRPPKEGGRGGVLPNSSPHSVGGWPTWPATRNPRAKMEGVGRGFPPRVKGSKRSRAAPQGWRSSEGAEPEGTKGCGRGERVWTQLDEGMYPGRRGLFPRDVLTT
jgi:hypothetical protein